MNKPIATIVVALHSDSVDLCWTENANKRRYSGQPGMHFLYAHQQRVDDAMVERACEGLQRANFPEGTMRDSSWISRPLIRAALVAALEAPK